MGDTCLCFIFQDAAGAMSDAAGAMSDAASAVVDAVDCTGMSSLVDDSMAKLSAISDDALESASVMAAEWVDSATAGMANLVAPALDQQQQAAKLLADHCKCRSLTGGAVLECSVDVVGIEVVLGIKIVACDQASLNRSQYTPRNRNQCTPCICKLMCARLPA